MPTGTDFKSKIKLMSKALLNDKQLSIDITRQIHVSINKTSLYTVKSVYAVTSIKRSPVLKCHLFIVLS